MKNVPAGLALLAAAMLVSAARAETLQLPEGSRAVALGKDRVICGDLPEGWWLSSDRRFVRPPATASAANRTDEVGIAPNPGSCARPTASLTLLATGRWPEIDPASVSFFPDEGRLQFKGVRLEGVQIVWHAGNRAGRETCLAPTAVGKIQQCELPLPRSLPASTSLRWLPAYAKDDPDTTTLDPQGRRLDPDTLGLRPARFVVSQIFSATETIDVSQGVGTVPLVHPEAVTSVDCGLGRCEVAEGGVIVRSVYGQATQITLNVRLAPRFFLSRGEKLDNSASATFALLRCPLSVVSGRPLRDASEPHILMRMANRCLTNSRLRWFVGTEPAEVVREVRGSDGDFVLLRTGELAGGSVTITATRVDTLAGVIGLVTTPTAPPPRPQSSIELPGRGPIDFIPTNREALWSVAGVAHAHLFPLELPGVYTVRTQKDQTFVRGDRHGGGLVSLRYAYRRDDMPEGFENVNLAVLTESVQRPLHQASIPVSFTALSSNQQPLAEFQCADAKGESRAMAPGRPNRITLAARDTCRVLIHQERLTPEDGPQEVVLEIEVTRANGRKRSDASVNEHLVLRPGGGPRAFFLKGVAEQFDQITVRLSHVVDESRYVLGPSGKQEPPSAQWSATVEGSRARLYVTLSVPAGLYRINEPAASMTLNFGVLGRITWLDQHGKEGLLGLETGVLGASLIPQQYNNSPAFPPTLVTLLGLGLRVEVGKGAAIGVHLWGAYEFRSAYTYTPTNATAPRTATHWSLLFGPSISIGNVGTNL
jgi:hypothetical protein